MPENIGGAGTGGMHPGKPVTRQTGAQTSGGVKESIGAGKPLETVSAGKTTAPTTPLPAETIGPPKPGRQLTLADLSAHLLSMEIPDTDFNLNFASMLLRYGIELSKENMSKALDMLNGTNKNVANQEAVLVLISKGINDSPEAVRILGEYLSSNPQLASQILSMKESLGNLLNAVLSSKGLLDVNIISRLNALISQFDDTLNDFGNEYSFNSKTPSIDRLEFLMELRALKALLKSLEEKSADKEQISKAINSTLSKLDGVLDNMIAQSILSQTNKKGDTSSASYQYYQIPNSFGNPPRNFEIMVKKDGSNSKIDPSKTEVVMSMETDALGKISIAMDINQKKVSFVFNTSDEETRSLIARESAVLRGKLADLNYETTGLRVRVNPAMSSVKQYLINFLSFDHLLRVDTKI